MKEIEREITINEIEKIDEENLMFITTPGRMGDEYGSTFVVKENENSFCIYRIEDMSAYWITMEKTFPKWNETLDNWEKDYESDRYVFVTMGFGNGLCVNKEIYPEFFEFLLTEVKKSDLYDENDGDDYNWCINFSAWYPAMINMFTNKKANITEITYDNFK